jgi:CelD/BcsL family acetyltransferase involved in cellulose biosynthesis
LMRKERDLRRSGSWLAVDEVREASSFAALREDWDRLLESSGAGIFNAWGWLYPWYRRLAPSAALRILTARDREGRLVGVLPLQLQTVRVLGRDVRRLSFLGERRVGSDYLEVIAARGYDGPVMRAMATALRDGAGGWDVLDLLDLDEASTTPAVLREVFSGFNVRRSVRMVCPWERFEQGESFESFLKRTRRRDNFLRRKKWLEKQAGHRVEITTRPEALARPLAEFFRLHALRWSEEGGSAGITGPEVEAFHRDATWALAESGKLRLYTMWVGDRAVASVYGIVHGDTFSYYQAGYDPAWRDKSVGMVLVGATFEDAIGLGLRNYDFLRGTETYKSDWVSKSRNTIAVRVVPSAGPGAWMDAAEQGARDVKRVLKRLLPEQTVQRLRRLRAGAGVGQSPNAK